MASPKKGALKQGSIPVFIDESAFYLLPGVVKTWAPVGQTPLLTAPLSREHLSVLGAVTEEGRVSLSVQERAVTGRDVARFLGHLVSVFGRRLRVFLDGAPIHRSHEVQAFLDSEAGSAVRLAPLPPYAPEVNPSEGLWRYSKQVELANVCCHDRAELKAQFRRAMDRLRRKPGIVQAFFKQALL